MLLQETLEDNMNIQKKNIFPLGLDSRIFSLGKKHVLDI